MTNDTSQCSVAMWFRCGWTFDFIRNLRLSLFWKNCLKQLNIWQSYGEKLIASSALCAGSQSC